MRKTGLVAAGLALTLTLVGCGTKQAGTPTAADDNSSSGSSQGGDLKVFGNALDLAGAVTDKSKSKQSAKLTMEASGAGQTMKGDGAFKVDGTDVAMRMSMDMAGLGKMEMVVVDKAFYMKIPAELGSTAGMPADKPWLKISAEGTDPLSKALGPMLENMGQNFDVGKQMEQIKTAGEITKSAKEPLDGQETTHYWIKVDMLKAAQAQTDPDLKKAAEDAAKAMPNKTVDMQMWVNTDNLPVQIVMTMPVTQGQTMDMKVKYLDWGQPVDITAPPANQIGEMPR
jgi:hypothetical protein